MEPDIAGVLGQFKSIKKNATQLYQDIISTDELLYNAAEEVTSLGEAFKDAKILFEKIRYRHKIGIYLRDIKMVGYLSENKQKALLRDIDIECEKAIGVLESIATPLSKEDREKLTSLRGEFKELSEVLPDINYERNLEDAINEYEKGDYLASALISGRVIIYALDQIPGKSDEEKVKFLTEKGIIEKGREDVQKSIIKANRRARAFFTHDIKVFPKTSETLSLLGDAIGILRIVSKL